jgi:hypothetical protein
MVIESIFILYRREGADYIALNTDLPCGTYPYKDKASFCTFVARGTAQAYAAEHFPGIKTNVVNEDSIPNIPEVKSGKR